MARITVVNDSPEFLDVMREVLEDARHDTTTIDGDRPDALDAIRTARPELLIIDVRLGVDGDRGWEIAQQIRREADFRGLPVLLCCADPLALRDLATDLESTREVETLPKPFSIDQLNDALERLLADPAVH